MPRGCGRGRVRQGVPGLSPGPRISRRLHFVKESGARLGAAWRWALGTEARPLMKLFKTNEPEPSAEDAAAAERLQAIASRFKTERSTYSRFEPAPEPTAAVPEDAAAAEPTEDAAAEWNEDVAAIEPSEDAAADPAEGSAAPSEWPNQD